MKKNPLQYQVGYQVDTQAYQYGYIYQYGHSTIESFCLLLFWSEYLAQVLTGFDTG